MTVIEIQKINEVHLRVYCEDMGVESELVDFFCFEVPGAKFMPMYKARLWDGKVRLLDPIRKTLYVGLLPYIREFADRNGYQVDYKNQDPRPEPISFEEIEQYAESLQICSKGNPIDIRDYQLEAVHKGLSDQRCMLVSPTGSGKSCIIYIISRWLIEQNKKILIICPTTGLVEQMHSDFSDYSTLNMWDAMNNCQKIYSGFSKDIMADITISTWQSIYKLPKQWFNQFDVVIGDECHLYKSKSLTGIMEKLCQTKYRFGTTGSLDDKKIHRLVLEGVFGPVHKVTTTSELQAKGSLADLKINSLVLKYPDDLKKSLGKIDYHQELDFLVTNDKRNKFLKNLALNTKGNTLVLFQFVEKHGAVLYKMIKESAGDRPVYFIHGGVSVDERENIRNILSTQTDTIVIASYQTMSTGINAPSIENIIFASPSKSMIRVLQSIGRGLRLNKGKTHCNLFDLTDDLHWKNRKNYTLLHGAERYKIYTTEGFKIKLVEINL